MVGFIGILLKLDKASFDEKPVAGGLHAPVCFKQLPNSAIAPECGTKSLSGVLASISEFNKKILPRVPGIQIINLKITLRNRTTFDAAASNSRILSCCGKQNSRMARTQR